PFKIEFVSVDWWTLYSIGQRVAQTFQYKDRILLAGDAAHTHSSGAAQGMNTGVHDAVNLAWKLAGVLKRHYEPEILQTYSSERRAVASHLIELDKNHMQRYARIW
ncbi:MAG: 3-hydroxybenzoate 4-monooxygenase, partial [Sphingobacteriaceae bacterium]